LYPVVRGIEPKGTGQAEVGNALEAPIDAVAVTFADSMPAAEDLSINERRKHR
jgi:hypothetical protein